MTTPSAWPTRRRVGSARTLHEPVPPSSATRTVDLLEIDAATLVLGSSQPEAIVDRAAVAAAGVAVVRRRSGGGAVLLVPGDHVWIDLWLPAGDPLWDDDVVRASWWLGDAWVRAAATLGQRELEVHRSNASRDGWAPVVCFAGAGPGEVFASGRKLVGVSARRTRAWTRFQCLVHRRWDAAATFGLLAVDGAAAAATQWQDRVAVVGGVDVASAFLDALRSA